MDGHEKKRLSIDNRKNHYCGFFNKVKVLDEFDIIICQIVTTTNSKSSILIIDALNLELRNKFNLENDVIREAVFDKEKMSIIYRTKNGSDLVSKIHSI